MLYADARLPHLERDEQLVEIFFAHANEAERQRRIERVKVHMLKIGAMIARIVEIVGWRWRRLVAFCFNILGRIFAQRWPPFGLVSTLSAATRVCCVVICLRFLLFLLFAVIVVIVVGVVFSPVFLDEHNI